jgi:hypothetical protein
LTDDDAALFPYDIVEPEAIPPPASPAHTPETLKCELIVDPEAMQLNNWQLHV